MILIVGGNYQRCLAEYNSQLETYSLPHVHCLTRIFYLARTETVWKVNYISLPVCGSDVDIQDHHELTGPRRMCLDNIGTIILSLTDNVARVICT
jgi:hypothetical protein